MSIHGKIITQGYGTCRVYSWNMLERLLPQHFLATFKEDMYTKIKAGELGSGSIMYGQHDSHGQEKILIKEIMEVAYLYMSSQEPHAYYLVTKRHLLKDAVKPEFGLHVLERRFKNSGWTPTCCPIYNPDFSKLYDIVQKDLVDAVLWQSNTLELEAILWWFKVGLKTVFSENS